MLNFKRMIRSGVMIMGIFSVVAAIFAGCSNRHDNGVFTPKATDRPFSEITSVPLTEGAEVTGLFITHQGGMRAGPYYILHTTDKGVYLKTSNLRPDDVLMTDGEDISVLPSNAKYLGFADIVKDCEYASSVLLKDDAPLRKIESAIVENGALAWDGYSENDPMEGVLDSGDSYQLYIELSDGGTVIANGYNVCPAGFMPLLRTVQEVFETNSDYSRYLSNSFTDSPCVSLFAIFKDGMRTEYRLELSARDNRWVTVLTDPYGNILTQGTEISDYGDMETALPFDRFIGILQQHKAEQWNGYYAADAKSNSSFTIRLTFEDGKKFEASGTVLPEGFGRFKSDFIREIYLFYNNIKGEKMP